MEGPLISSGHLGHPYVKGDSGESFGPPPTFLRLPPDGHEFPQEYRDPSMISNDGFHPNLDALSRKSSTGSIGSLDRSDFLLERVNSYEARSSRPILRHDENSVSGVRAKIALFSSGGMNTAASSSCSSSTTISQTTTSTLTRSLTHSDVRYEVSDDVIIEKNDTEEVMKTKTCETFRSMLNVSSSCTQEKMKKESMSTADLGDVSTPIQSTCGAMGRSHIQGRSQSLLEIGSNKVEMLNLKKNSALAKGARSRSSGQMNPGLNNTRPSSSTPENPSSILEQRRRSALSKLKGLVIPESNETFNPQDVSAIKSELTTPPWKSSNSSAPKYSPAFKRKPFTIYNNIKTTPEPVRQKSFEKKPSDPRPTSAFTRTSDSKIQKRHSGTLLQNMKSDQDSDNDSAVSSGKSSLSHGSSSPPPPVSKMVDRKGSGYIVKKSDSIDEDAESIRILKKDSIEAINRRNIIESCRMSSGVVLGPVMKSPAAGYPKGSLVANVVKKFPNADEIPEDKILRNCPPPLGKPASRSSSFTIAERKKSFEAASARLTDRHSSQDSLSSRRRGTVDNLLEGLARRRNSNDSPTSDSSISSAAVMTPLSRTESLASENSYPSTRSGSIVSVIERISFGRSNDDENRWNTSEKRSSHQTALHTPLAGSSETSLKLSRFEKVSDGNSTRKDIEKTTNERPTDLPFAPPRKLSSASPSGLGKTFKELAERWEKGSTSSPSALVSPQSIISCPEPFMSKQQLLFANDSFFSESSRDETDDSSSMKDEWESMDDNKCGPTFYLPEESTEWESFDPSTPQAETKTETHLVFHQNPFSDRKFSVPLFPGDERSGLGGKGSMTGTVKMRDKNNSAPSRPSSLIETGGPEMKEMKVFEIGNLGDHGGRHRGILGPQSSSPSNSTSRGSSQADLLDCSTTSDTPKSPLPGSSSRELLDVFGKQDNRRCVSVNDIRRAFEKAEQSLSESVKVGSGLEGLLGLSPSHHRMSSLDSTTSEESSIPTPHNCYGSVSSLISGQTNLKDHYGSITSLASSTSLISPQELQGLIDEANQSLEESGTPSHEIMVIVLHREFSSGSIGITLAGGADYESKEITVHKVIPGTLADRDGRIQKGDRVLSINGRSTKGVTHREALSILKAPRAEVVLVLSRSRSVTPAADFCYDRSDYPAYTYINSGRPPKILESPLDSKSLLSDLKFVDVPRGPPFTVILKKEGTGLGFSLEGGKDSPLGDRPLTIKKIFAGGAADKSGKLKVGDEILSVNNTDCSRMTRLEAWNFMKKLSDGYASLVVRQKIDLPKSINVSSNPFDNVVKNESRTSSTNCDTHTTSSTSTVKTPTPEITSEQPIEVTKDEAKR